MHKTLILLSLAFMSLFSTIAPAGEIEGRWSAEKSNQWYEQQPWLVGANFVPSTAINQLEMWQPDTFDPDTIDRELAMAEGIGMNTMRVFLHDLLWQQDKDAFYERIDFFLDICEKHKIKPMLILFDSGVIFPPPNSPIQTPDVNGCAGLTCRAQVKTFSSR